MNIWYLHHYATPDAIAGLHRPFEFGKYFIKNSNEITVFSSSYLHYDTHNMIENGDKFCVKDYEGIAAVFVKTCSYANSSIRRILNMFQFFARVKPVAKRYAEQTKKPDVIIASSPHPLTMLAGIKLAKKYKVPCICEVRDFWPEVFFMGGVLKEKGVFGKILLKGERWLYKRSAALLFLKEGDREYIREHKWDKESGGPIDMEKCYYVNNGVDLALFDRRVKENTLVDSDLKSEKFTVTYCGTIRPVNNVGVLVDVAKLVGEDVQILVYGSGNCVDDIEKQIKENNLTNIKLKGYIDNKFVPYILSCSNASLLNYSANDYNWSRGNSSNKLFEYLASGRPVISTVKMGYDILSRYDCGVSAEECTPQAIAESILKIKNEPIERYTQMCQNAKKAASEFDIPKLADKYLSVIGEVKNKFEEIDRK